jgi:hypothetical protein
MVLMLGAALDVPLRDQNLLLDSAGFPAAFDEPALEGGMPPAIAQAIDRMLAQHEPFPMLVLNRMYDVRRTNEGARRVLSRMILEPEALDEPPNLLRALMNPRLARPFVVDWERTARVLLSRMHRESLQRPSDGPLAGLLSDLVAYPDVPASVRQPDFSLPSDATFTVRLRRGDLDLAFLTTLTVFSAPQNVTLEELKLESYFPLDEVTARACQRLAASEA